MSRGLEKKCIELAGIYAAASELCKRGYLVTVTLLGTYPTIDLLDASVASQPIPLGNAGLTLLRNVLNTSTSVEIHEASQAENR